MKPKMNPKWEKIRKIIRKDANVQNTYKDEDGKTCVLGGLAEAAHIKLPKLIYNSESIDHKALQSFRKQLKKVYGLNNFQLDELQNINDNNDVLRERRYRLIEFTKFEEQ